MRTFLTLVLLNLLSVGSFGQVGLEGIYLGSKGVDGNGFTRTVAGIEGIIFIDTINDGRIYWLGFVPGDGTQEKRVYKIDLERMISELESNYGATFEIKKRDIQDPEEYYIASFKIYGRRYAIVGTIEKNESLDPPVKLALIMSDKGLFKIKERERLSMSNIDY